MPRVTQKDIARLAGVSQTTVSFVLNEREENLSRVPADTRARVLRVIQETGYVADPIARRLRLGGTRMIGVYTFEALFPAEREDFFFPVLAGIEAEAQRRDHDLLLLTGGRSGGRPAGLTNGSTRLRLADACILLGQYVPVADLEHLIDVGYPFVSVGRRVDVGAGPVPWVAADYTTAVADLVGRARAEGHQRLAYLGYGRGAVSYVDRMAGFHQAVPGGLVLEPVGDPQQWCERLLADGVTAVLAEQAEQVDKLVRALATRGLQAPDDLSLLSLSGSPELDGDVTGFTLPRREMGARALAVLTEGREISAARPDGSVVQELLGCTYRPGRTLGPPPA